MNGKKELEEELRSRPTVSFLCNKNEFGCMEKSIDVSFSDQAQTIVDAADADEEEVVDFLVENGGFTVGGNEVIAFLENKRGR